jgi:hypothetical protein
MDTSLSDIVLIGTVGGSSCSLPVHHAMRHTCRFAPRAEEAGLVAKEGRRYPIRPCGRLGALQRPPGSTNQAWRPLSCASEGLGKRSSARVPGAFLQDSATRDGATHPNGPSRQERCHRPLRSLFSCSTLLPTTFGIDLKGIVLHNGS